MAKYNPSDYPKFRKWHGSHQPICGIASEKSARLSVCKYGIKTVEPMRLTPSQLESVRKVLINILGKTYIIINRVFAHMPITKKPLAVRMGGGAGEPVSWAALVKPGSVLLEIDGSDKSLIMKALNAAAYKLPCKTKIICGLGDEI